MNRFLAAAATIALVVAFQPALAQPAKPAAAASQALPPMMTPAEFDKRLAQMNQHMQQMQAQMDKIAKTQDPQERQRLLQEHWNSMHAAMGEMRGLWGPGGPGCCAGNGPGPGMMGRPGMGWGHMRGYYAGLTPEQMRQRQYMMDQYMPMQQQMLDHMMWHQRWVLPPAAPATK